MLDLLRPGGIIMFPLLLCSVLALAIIIERFWTLRINRLAPKSMVQDLWASIRKKELNARKIKELKEVNPVCLVPLNNKPVQSGKLKNY